MTCIIEFRGNWVLTGEWKEQTRQGEKVLSVGFNTLDLNQRITSTLVMPVLNSSRNYSFIIKFGINGKPPMTSATNIPDDVSVWTFVSSQGILMRYSISRKLIGHERNLA